MKIQPSDKIQESIQKSQANNASKAQASEKLKNAQANQGPQAQKNISATDDVKADISTRAVEFSQARDIARSAPDVREDLVASLKDRINSGSYQVNADSLADRIFNEHLRTNGIGV